MNDIRATSQLTQELNQRIQTNQKFGDADMKSWLLEKLNFRPSECLLDIGCGTGAYLVPFAKQIKTDWAVTGVDLSTQSVETAKQACDREGLKVNLFVENMDELNECGKKGPFDTITFAYSAYYSKNAAQMLTGLLPILKPSGRMAILGPYLDNNQEWFDFLRQFMELPHHAIESSSTFMGNVVVPFALANFGQIECSRFVNNVTMPNLSELQKYWEASTYFASKYNRDFQKFTELHFNAHQIFRFRKAALLVVMSQKGN